MARSATSPEVTLYRTPGKKSLLRAAFLKPPIVYRARINQTFTTFDMVLSIIYDGGSGTLADVLPDMEVWIGSSLDSHDKGICRLREKDATHFYLSETSEIAFANDDYVTILPGFGIWARPARILEDGTVYMDEVEYTDQHTNWDPQPNMGADRVLDLTGVSTVTTTFHAGTSFCLGSSIASYAWSCATASASSDPTAADVTFEFNTGGLHLVYLTLTGANGKVFFGVRNVFVKDETHSAFEAEISNPGRCDVDSGGWEIKLTLFGGADLADVYERAMVILFSEDYYGGTKSAIGPVAGSENIKFIGWISKEDNHLSAEQGSVTFTAHGAAYWMSKIPSWPDGVELTSGTPDWTKIVSLTVDLGVYHFLRHRTTATRIMDITLTGDTRISNEVSSSAQNLWGQIQEMTWNQIYARPGVNALNQLSIQIHPCLIPTADRDYPTVMAITKADYEDNLDFERAIVDDVGIVDMSGVQVTAPDDGSAWFALAPGHSLPHYGEWDIQPNLLLASQAQVITLAGLYRSWKNNPFKSIPLVFKAPIGLIDCFPNQRCTINIATGDNVRGFAYSGGLIPTSVQLVQDPKTGYAHTEVTFEAETSESQSRVGDTPGSGDPSQRPTPSLPPLVLPPIIIPGLPGTPPVENITVVAHSRHLPDYGVVYTEDFDGSGPTWYAMNAGLTVLQKRDATWLKITPSGAVYIGADGTFNRGTTNRDLPFLAYAPSVGQPFVIIEDPDSLEAKYITGDQLQLGGFGYRPDRPDTVVYIAGQRFSTDVHEVHLYLGSGTGGFATPFHTTTGALRQAGNGTFGEDTWSFVVVGIHGEIDVIQFNAACTEQTGLFIGGWSIYHSRAGLTGTMFIQSHTFAGDQYLRTTNNGEFWEVMPDSSDVPGAITPDDTGQFAMGNWQSNKGRSSDFGTTWYGIPNLPPGGGYIYTYAGGTNWIAAGSIIRESSDFGGTWNNKEGDVSSLLSTLGIDLLAVLRGALS